MKPIKIIIKGINSYVSEQVIDFNKLAENKIFGIFGETGSGKTTILDSIILALYGVSDRDNLQNIINVNTKDAYVEYTFEMEENTGKSKKYMIRRDFHLRPSGLKTEAILNDLNTKKTIAEMPDNVNAKILEIIGIGKKEFTKCIALPQGEFDRFLSDTPSLRKKTLAKLFDLEQFGIILNEKLKKRKDLVALNRNTLQEKIAVYNGISKETIAKTEEILANSDKQEKSLKRLLARDKKLAETIKEELAVKQELLDYEVNLNIKQSELPEINYIEKQIEYTEKYGDFTILNSKYNSCYDELEALNIANEENKKLLGSCDEQFKKLAILIEDNQNKISDVTKQLGEIDIQNEKRRLHEAKLNNLISQKQDISDKLVALSEKMVENNAVIQKYKTNIIDLTNTYKKIENTIFDNMDSIDKLNNCQTFKTKQDFALFLTITRSKINPDSLAEVEEFNIYDEVNTAIHDLENYELGVRKEIADILKDLHTLEIDYNNLDDIKDDLIKKNEKLNKQCDEIEDSLVEVKEKLASAKTNMSAMEDQIAEYNDSLEQLKVAIANEKEVFNEMAPVNDEEYLHKTLEVYTKESEKLQEQLDKLNAQKQKAIIDIEVNTNNIENYKERLSQLSTALKPYSKAMFKEKVDNSLLLSYDDLPNLKQKVESYHKELSVLEANTNKLREKTKDYIYTKDDYNNLIDSVNNNEEKLTELKVFINVNKITIDIQRQNLATVLELQSQLYEVLEQYNAIEQLESLLAGGALIDFVAEEYMGLITDFANHYVYSISKGKYLLNYDGDFNVIDNFNGGIKRSVKTLSGGERFIVSLSLALGISQSIAVNNNKNFNFFFIDEGFGNLSENYIEKVLQSFDALIQLNFTVGFITHVEKMQYYLSNRIIVTKDNTDEGSKIEQFY